MANTLPYLTLATDMVIFNMRNMQLHILLVKRKSKPFVDSRCLPWWFVHDDITVAATAYKVLYKETHIVAKYMKQFDIFSDLNRDPRWRIVGVGYYTIICNDDIVPLPWDTQEQAMFIPLQDIPSLAFDHDRIRRKAYDTLRKDIEWSDIVRYFLPHLFTLDTLKQHCEVIYNRSFEKRNFAKYVKTHFKIQKTSYKEKYVAHRPAVLYKFSN